MLRRAFEGQEGYNFRARVRRLGPGERNGRTTPAAPTHEPPLEDRLDSWKEIAAYLKRDVTTVQRWEKREGMPVHRHLHDRMGSVSASRAELAAWTRKRNLPPAQETVHNGLETTAPAASAQPPNRTFLTSWTFILPLAVVTALAMAAALWLQRTERFWRSPIADARFQTVTNFDGLEQEAAVSRDGHLVAFLSDRDGPMDVWVTQAGSGAFHNLTHGSIQELANPLIRTPGFSPDGSLVTFWVRKPGTSGGDEIGIWAVPTLGGEARPYLEGVAEFDWSRDGSRLVYHTPGPGDPLFVSNGSLGSVPIYTAPAGMHSHFPTWAPDGAFIYFVQGELPDKLDIWRIRPTGGTPERITSHMGRVSHPVLLDRRTLMYLATDRDGSGPWLYSMDVERRIPHRLSSGLDRYTSLAATPDGRRLVATLASPRRTLWRMQLPSPANEAPFSPGANLADHQHRFFPTAGRRLPAVCFSQRYWREYLEARQRSGHGVMESPGSPNLRRPGDRTGRAQHCVFGPATRANTLVR